MSDLLQNYRWFGVITGGLFLITMVFKVPLENTAGYSETYYCLLMLLPINIASVVLMSKRKNWRIGFVQGMSVVLLLISVWVPWNTYIFLGKEIAQSANAEEFGWETLTLYETKIVLETGGPLGQDTRIYSDYTIEGTEILIEDFSPGMRHSWEINGKTYRVRGEHYR
jgi:hypothetical protein